MRIIAHRMSSNNVTSSTPLVTVPEEYRPKNMKNGSLFYVTGSGGFGAGDFHVKADGTCDQGTTNQLASFIAVVEYSLDY